MVTAVLDQYPDDDPQSESQSNVTNLPLQFDGMPCLASWSQKKSRFQMEAVEIRSEIKQDFLC